MLRAQRIERAGRWPRDKARGTITLAFEDRHRRRIRLATDAGEAFLLDLPRAVVLDVGDGLALDDGSWIEVRPAPERLIEVRAASVELFARLAWHIGNRHLPAQILSNRILLREDAVVVEMLRGLGAEVRLIEAPFTPERGAYDESVDPHRDHGDHAHKH
jgi:urease accessory protein